MQGSRLAAHPWVELGMVEDKGAREIEGATDKGEVGKAACKLGNPANGE